MYVIKHKGSAHYIFWFIFLLFCFECQFYTHISYFHISYLFFILLFISYFIPMFACFSNHFLRPSIVSQNAVYLCGSSSVSAEKGDSIRNPTFRSGWGRGVRSWVLKPCFKSEFPRMVWVDLHLGPRPLQNFGSLFLFRSIPLVSTAKPLKCIPSFTPDLSDRIQRSEPRAPALRACGRASRSGSGTTGSSRALRTTRTRWPGCPVHDSDSRHRWARMRGFQGCKGGGSGIVERAARVYWRAQGINLPK